MPRAAAPQRIISKILDPVVRFFTLNRVYSISPDLRQQVPKVMIKRVLAIPGDSVKIEKNSILVKPSNEKFYLKETQSTPVLYRFQEEDSPVTHEETAVSREITLGKNEYYLAGDNRPESNDSRDFGPVDFSSIIGRVIFRYWPLRKISAF